MRDGACPLSSDGPLPRASCQPIQLSQSTPAQAMRCRSSACWSSHCPNPNPINHTISSAPPLAPRMIGSAAGRPKRALLLSTRILVGPGLIEATRQNSRNGHSVFMPERPGGEEAAWSGSTVGDNASVRRVRSAVWTVCAAAHVLRRGEAIGATEPAAQAALVGEAQVRGDLGHRLPVRQALAGAAEPAGSGRHAAATRMQP